MEEFKNIHLNLGDVSQDKNLGAYYIDMRPAKVHYTQNIYNGKFDENGVPMIGADNGLAYFPINIAQYGFMLHADYIQHKKSHDFEALNNCLEVLEHIKSDYKETNVWWHHHFEKKYQINPPWASAMAQGEIISLYLRVYQITEQKELLETAQKAYEFLKIPVENGGVRRFDEQGNLWFEEYPSEKPSLVLNGFIYTLLGLYDLYRITKRQDIELDINECIKTLEHRLPDFDSGFWSYYDIQKQELVRYYYQKNVHVPQMEVLYKLTAKKFLK